MNKKFVIIGIIVLVLGLWAAAFFVSSSDDNEESNTSNNTDTSEQVPTAPEEELPEDEEGVEGVVTTADLVSVRDTEEAGTATRTVSESRTLVSVTATLNPPREGKFYEGWVVGNGRVISTGELTMDEDGNYVQEFSADEDLTAQSRYVLTEETLANGLDDNPEDHVIEGDFVN